MQMRPETKTYTCATDVAVAVRCSAITNSISSTAAWVADTKLRESDIFFIVVIRARSKPAMHRGMRQYTAYQTAHPAAVTSSLRGAAKQPRTPRWQAARQWVCGQDARARLNQRSEQLVRDPHGMAARLVELWLSDPEALRPDGRCDAREPRGTVVVNLYVGGLLWAALSLQGARHCWLGT